MGIPPSALALLLAAAPSDAALVEAIDEALLDGARFLLAAQDPDGAFRSKSYAAFKDGYSLGPLILSALYFAPPDPAIVRAYDRGADFLAGAVSVGRFAYPSYSKSGAILVLSVDRNARHAAARDRLVELLRLSQLDERLGWTKADPSYGGWGYWLEEPRKPPPDVFRHELLSSNLSATLFAIAALAFAGVSLDDPAFIAARTFVERCQNFAENPKRADRRFDDGGFFFTPDNDIQNKAMAAGKDRSGKIRYTSYGTMSADGMRALIRLGLPRTHPRVRAAADWIRTRFDPERASGDYPEVRELQRASAYYYYAWTTSHALAAMGERSYRRGRTEVDWPASLSQAILQRKRDDGSWSNPSGDLREDDPLIATPFAMAALEVSRMMITGRWRTAIRY